MAETTGPEQRRVLVAQAEMIERVSTGTVPEAADREDVHRRYLTVLALHRRLDGAGR
jgi:hypothetical protein